MTNDTRLVNKLLPSPGVKFKQSSMPFVQMENISQFLRACSAPPLNMPAHDRFLTVDLYEAKDPAQVLQCLGAFSRVANSMDPAQFPSTLGPKKVAAPMSPVSNGARSSNTSPYITSGSFSRPSSVARPISPVKTGGSTASSNAGTRGAMSPISSWSKKGDEGHTSPAWNIMQYGYMGGASQNNQGISFGGRRQITSAGNELPNAAEKERRRKEQAAEDELKRIQAEEEEQSRRIEREAEEERQRVAEEQRWEEETQRLREQERIRLAEQKRQWEEEERGWKIKEEARKVESDDINQRLSKHMTGDSRLNGQFLSQYQAEQAKPQPPATSENDRVRQLEQQLQEARERERQYQMERDERNQTNNDRPQSPMAKQEKPVSTASTTPAVADRVPSPPIALPEQSPSRVGLQDVDTGPRPAIGSTRPLPIPKSIPLLPERATGAIDSPRTSTQREAMPSPRSPCTRPQPSQPPQNSVERYLASEPAPQFDKRPTTHQPEETRFSSTAEEQADRDRRIASQQQTKAGGWASKSILEREMEQERERQREWEEQQAAKPQRPAGRVMGPRPLPSSQA